jgi:hypothetical protein
MKCYMLCDGNQRGTREISWFLCNLLLNGKADADIGKIRSCFCNNTFAGASIKKAQLRTVGLGLLVARFGNENVSGGLNNVCIPVDTGLSVIRFLDYAAVN